MNSQIVIVLVSLYVSLAYSAENIEYETVKDINGRQYYLIPHDYYTINSRTKRQTSGGVSNTGFGVSLFGNILSNDKDELDGTAFASKQFHGPLTTGGSLDYSHKSTGSGLAVGTAVTGEYNRHFAGPGGTGRPNYGAFLNFQHRF